MKYSILIAVLVYEVLVIGGVGIWLARREAKREHQEGDFALGGRNLPVSVVAVTLALTVLGTAHILGEFEMAWFMGAAAIWFSIAHVILLVVVCSSTGLWMRRLGVSTVPEILEILYGPGTRLIVSCEGIPLRSRKYFLSQCSFCFPNSSMYSQPSAPAITASTANARMSVNS